MYGKSSRRSFRVRRASEIFQSAVVRSGRRVDGRRMVDGHCQHEHVHVRNRSGVHTDGERGVGQDAGDHRMAGGRLDFRTRRVQRGVTPTGRLFARQRFQKPGFVFSPFFFFFFKRPFRLAGGSISNMYAFLAARHKMFPGYKEQGLHSIKGQLVMYTSDQVRARTVVVRKT